MLKTIVDALTIDVVSLCPIASHSPLWETVRLTPAVCNNCRFSRIRKIFRFFEIFIRQTGKMVLLGRWTWPRIGKNSFLFVAFTGNQFEALDPVAKTFLEKGRIVDFHNVHDHPDNTIWRLTPWAYLIAIFFFPLVLWRMLIEEGYRKESFAWALDRYWLAYGLYVVYRKWLRYSRPKALILSNDHHLMPCVLVEAAKAESVATYYIQHAAVTSRFPPLRFDYALLDGVDAAEKYLAAGNTDTSIALIGISKSDNCIKHPNNSAQLNSLGIAFSRADDIHRAERLLREISHRELDCKTIVRLHPRMQDRYGEHFIKVSQDLGFEYSPKSEGSFDFLNRIDVLIAGVSAISLEAALINVTPINFQLSEQETDWYGFIESGLCETYNTTESLVERLLELMTIRPNVKMLAKKYCATLGSPYEGHSSELASEVIEHTLHRHRQVSRTQEYSCPANGSYFDVDELITLTQCQNE